MKKFILISLLLFAVTSEASFWDDAIGYAKKINESNTTKKVKKKSSEIWDATKETSGNAWDHTKKATTKGWESTKENSAEVYDGAKNLYKDITK